MTTLPQMAPRTSLAPLRRATRWVATLDLGYEPPLDVDGERHEPIDRRLISLRWLLGTVLTGLAGAALMGSAMYAALDHQASFAERPQMTGPARREAAAGDFVNPHKGDRLVKSVDIVAAKHTFRAPTTIKVGDKEFVKIRTFERVSTTLLLTSAGFGDEVPAFNPLRIISDDRNPAEAPPPDPGPVQDEAEVSFTTHDIAGSGLAPDGAALTLEEVEAQVAEHVHSMQEAGSKPPLPIPPQLLLMRTSHASLNPAGSLTGTGPGAGLISAPFSSIEVRMVPENVSTIPRARGPKQSDERLYIVRHNETFEDVLRTAGATPGQIKDIVAAFGLPRGQSPASEGERVKILFADMDGDDQMQIARLSVYRDETLEATVALADSGQYVQVSHAQAPAADQGSDDAEDTDDSRMRLYNSLYETALKQDIPKPLISQLVHIFANDVDFQRPVTAGDSFDAFYEKTGEGDSHDELLYASITAHGETYRYYRFETPDDHMVDWYDGTGRSSRKFLIRQPVAGGRLTSTFGPRFHPILGYTRMHTGVDWAAPIGTPIVAAGNGTIIKAGRESGYGNRVEIQHANGYITTYNHMSGFAKGIHEGIHVRQGQVIGYLGMTGLATGPHLHYEVIVNGHFVDPLKVKLARTRELKGALLTDFRRDKARIDGLMAKAPTAADLASTAPGQGG